VSLILAYGVYDSRRTLEELAEIVELRTADADELRTEVRHLRHFHRTAVPGPGDFLVGTDVTGDSVVTLDTPSDGIYYVLQSTCPVCPRNFPALHELSAAAHDRFLVAAVSLVDSLNELESYGRKHSLAIPLLQAPAGGFVDLLPKYGTPFTIVVSGGCIVAADGGVLTAQQIESFAFFSRREPPEPGSAWAEDC
jgi:hypothetical protein